MEDQWYIGLALILFILIAIAVGRLSGRPFTIRFGPRLTPGEVQGLWR
jgi:hypothetical protein